MSKDEDWKQTGAWADPESDDCSNGFWHDLTGAPTKHHFGNALQVWALMQDNENVTMATAALAFNVPPARIYEAVEDHSWLFIGGDGQDPAKDIIEHEGE